MPWRLSIIDGRADDARPAQDRHPRRARAQQLIYTGIACGAAGIHIVDQYHRLAAKRASARWRHGKCSRHRPAALMPAEPPQQRRRPRAAEQTDIALNARKARQGLRHQRGLIEAAPPQPPSVQRHRHQDIGIGGDQAAHMAGHGFGIGSPPPIFQPQRDRSRDIAISDGRAHPGMARRRGNTSGAADIIASIIRQRQIAACAPWRRDEMQLAPAGGTKAVILPRREATSWAARRQDDIGRKAKRPAHEIEAAHRPLSPRRAIGTSAQMSLDPASPPEIFDRAARRQRRDRAFADFGGHDFLHRLMIDGITERLASVSRTFHDVLDLGGSPGGFRAPPGARIAALDPGFRFASTAGGVQGDEDRLPFADGAFDLVVSAGLLDSVNDLPGALSLIRRVLRPDGLFLGSFIGAGSLATLRAVLRDAEGDRPVPRLHPQIDVRAGGDLLMRAGFALPVADTDQFTVRYGDLFGLVADLRGMAASNLLPGRQILRRDTLARAAQAFAVRADGDGRTRENFEIVHLSGWAPAPSQPQPARRGSATASLAAALRPKGA